MIKKIVLFYARCLYRIVKISISVVKVIESHLIRLALWAIIRESDVRMDAVREKSKTSDLNCVPPPQPAPKHRRNRRPKK